MDSSMGYALLVIVGGLLVFFAAGIWVPFAMTLLGVVIFVAFEPLAIAQIGPALFNAPADFVLAAIPLFIFLGHIILASGISERVYRGASILTRPLPGGLLHTNIVVCAMFAAVSGSATATAATIGTVAVPQQLGRGYSRKLVFGSLAAGGTLGVLIPPSIVLIVYGAFTQVSVARLFAAGLIPGVILGIMFSLAIMIAAIIWPDMAPRRDSVTKAYLFDALRGLYDLWPAVGLMIVVLGGIYSGQATPTEAAALGCLVAVLMAAGMRRLSLRTIWNAGVEAARTSSMILFLFVGGKILGTALSAIRLPRRLVEMVGSLGVEPMVVWAILVFTLVILGMLMDDFAMLVMTLPVIFPLMLGLGFDPIWFGIEMTLLVQVALITPPVGLNLFVINAISPDKRLEDVAIGVIPFAVILLCAIALFTVADDLILWLPSRLFSG